MTKTALVIGINYTGTANELKGCIRDAEQVYHMLKFDLAYDKVVLMTDESHGKYAATRTNILANMQEMIKNATEGDQLFLHYSGHGTQIHDPTGKERDGKNECLVPLDSIANGYITDDELREVLAVPRGVRMVAVLDCCNSGTALDLRYRLRISSQIIKCKVGRVDFASFKSYFLHILRNGFTTSEKHSIEELVITHDVPETKGQLVMLSGCRDDQYSVDVSYGGVLTLSLLDILKENNYNISYLDLLKKVRTRAKDFYCSSQIPQMTFGCWASLGEDFF